MFPIQIYKGVILFIYSLIENSNELNSVLLINDLLFLGKNKLIKICFLLTKETSDLIL